MSEISVYDQSDFSETSGVPTFLLKTLHKLSVAVYDIEKLRERKEYCKQKLIERSGGESEWRKGKFVYAISAVTAFLYDIDNFIRKADALTDMVCRYLAFFNNAKYIHGDKLNLTTESRYISIEQQSGPTTSTRLLKQRSPEWHALRKQAKITGSTAFKALGLDGLGKQKDHFEKVICGVPESEPTVECKKNMEHGTVNEVNAVATVVGKILPVLEPHLKFCEEGCVAVEQDDGQVFLVVSPDGSLRKENTLDSSEVAVEIKCPVRKVHTEFPDRYLLQCLFEIKVLNVDTLLYVSWGAEHTNVFRVYKNEELLRRTMKLATEIYGNEKPKKPTRLSADVRALKEEISRESKGVKVVGRFHSCTSADVQNKYDEETKTKEGLIKLTENLREIYLELYNLRREKATEAVVFILADLDRSWARNTIRSSPVAWFTKGYSLDGETMRAIAENVHTECHKAGIHVPCESFDGQWHTLVVRDVEGKPLTLYQLQRELWKEVEAKSKKEIIEVLKCMNGTPICMVEEIMNSEGETKKHIHSTNGGLRQPKYRHVTNTNKKTYDKEDRTVVSDTTLADTVSDIVRETAGIDESVLALSKITDEMEFEAFSNNIDDEHWSEEIQRVQDVGGNSLEEDVTQEDDHHMDEIREAETQTMTNAAQVLENKLDDKDLECMLALLRSTKDCNKNGKWNNASADGLIERFASAEKVSSFLDVELRTIVRYLKKTKGLKNILESKPKKMKVDAIAAFLNLPGECLETKKKSKRVFTVKSLKDTALKAVSNYSKQDLNIVLAEYLWEEKYRLWKSDVSTITLNNGECEWFYKPEKSSVREQAEVKCIDSTHLFTRMRRKSCKGGMEGLSNKSWLKVAQQKKTLLTPIMVEEVTDPMSVSMAKTHFSESVENEMRRNGDIPAADLCRDIRKWWESEDSPGIDATKRIEMRKPLRARLLEKIDFSRFPPPTQYISGWQVQLWEAVIANIDAKAYLYSLTHNGTYNVRAFSSLIGETFFSELVLHDKRGQGTVSTKDFGEYIGYTTEQLQIRLDRDRKFAYCTARRKVYDVVDESYESDSEHFDGCRVCREGTRLLGTDIQTRDHAFDKEGRKKLVGRRKHDHVPMDRNAEMRGTLGVRWEKARCNYSKMLVTKRMGIPDDGE